MIPTYLILSIIILISLLNNAILECDAGAIGELTNNEKLIYNCLFYLAETEIDTKIIPNDDPALPKANEIIDLAQGDTSLADKYNKFVTRRDGIQTFIKDGSVLSTPDQAKINKGYKALLCKLILLII